LASILALLALPGSARAHTGDQSYLYMQITDDVQAELHMPFNDLNEHLGLGIEGSDDEIEEIIASNESAISDYAAEHFGIGVDGQFWDEDPVDVFRLENNEYVIATFRLDVAAGNVPDQLVVDLDPFFDENGDRDALFLVANDWERGYVGNDDSDQLARFTAGSRNQQIDIGDRSWVKNFTSSMTLGIDHIKTGPDHVLFVAVLLLPAVLAWAGTWRPVESFGPSLDPAAGAPIRRDNYRGLYCRGGSTQFEANRTATRVAAGLRIWSLPWARVRIPHR